MEYTTLRVGIDVGGTFTDVVAIDTQSGEMTTLKVSSTPLAPERGVLEGLRLLLARYPQRPKIDYLAHSTTIATNALLGQMNLELPRVVFLTTAGFRDVLEIGRQNRSEVYNLFVTRPKPLAARGDRIGVNERMDFDGNVLEPLEDAEIGRVIEAARARSPGAIAIGLLHAYANDAHERRLAEACARTFCDIPIVRSSEIDPQYREYERFSTTVVTAALAPIVRGYIERLVTELRLMGVGAPLYVMQSNGGMATAKRVALRPATIIESGPASGVIAAADAGRRLRADKVLSFDMGGTTAKAGTIVDGVAQISGEFEAAGATHSGRSVKGSGYPVRFPFVDLAEVSAGGGTIAWVDDAGSLRVGPLSAGADPGPACYGKSDYATVTDANVVLGRLNPTHLLGGSFPIDAAQARAAIATLARAIGLSPEATASGIVTLVDTQMAKVLRIVTVERGLDPRDFTMIAFGGNGPLHACALAEELGIARVIVPRHPGVFSALGLLFADLRASFVRPLLRTVDELQADHLEALFAELENEGRRALRDQGASDDAMSFRREYDARYRGQSFEIDIAHVPDAGGIVRAFHDKHERRYGYAVADEPVELVNARLTAVATLPHVRACAVEVGVLPAAPSGTRTVWVNGTFGDVPVYTREGLPFGTTIAGPAIVEQYDSCTDVRDGWRATVSQEIVLERM